MTHTHRTAEAKDVKVGDELMIEYYDSEGALQHVDPKVTSVKLFTRKIRITLADGWGTETYPVTRVLGIKEA